MKDLDKILILEEYRYKEDILSKCIAQSILMLVENELNKNDVSNDIKNGIEYIKKCIKYYEEHKDITGIFNK